MASKPYDDPALGAYAANAEKPEPQPKKRDGVSVHLIPVNNSDQPVFANYAMMNLAPGTAFIDFGFVEPAVVAALSQMTQTGGELPEAVSGKLAVRMAVGYDMLVNLHQQLTQVLTSLNNAEAAGKKNG
jgi:hypothetical protein